MGVLTAKPHHSLASFVESYALRLAAIQQPWVHLPLPARSDCFLEFYLRDPYTIVSVETGEVHTSPRAVLVGPHDCRLEDLLYQGNLHVFTVRFSAIGFRALFGIPARHLLNRAEPASAVLGKSAEELADRLAATDGSLNALAEIADRFLLDWLLNSPEAPSTRRVGGAARFLQRNHGVCDIGQLAAACQLSTRQLERDFLEQVGMPPKTFARLQRLQYALSLKGTNTSTNWADIAATAGYYDQTHLVRDFKAMTGTTPVQFAEMWQRGMDVWRQPRPISPQRSDPKKDFKRDVAFVLFGAEEAGLR